MKGIVIDNSPCFHFPVFIATPITAFLAVIIVLIISSIVCIVARKKAEKNEQDIELKKYEPIK